MQFYISSSTAVAGGGGGGGGAAAAAVAALLLWPASFIPPGTLNPKFPTEIFFPAGYYCQPATSVPAVQSATTRSAPCNIARINSSLYANSNSGSGRGPFLPVIHRILKTNFPGPRFMALGEQNHRSLAVTSKLQPLHGCHNPASQNQPLSPCINPQMLHPFTPFLSRDWNALTESTPTILQLQTTPN